MSVDLTGRLQEGALSASKTPGPPEPSKLVPLPAPAGPQNNGSAPSAKS